MGKVIVVKSIGPVESMVRVHAASCSKAKASRFARVHPYDLETEQDCNANGYPVKHCKCCKGS